MFMSFKPSFSPRRALIVFMRYPEAGKVKSRLAASMGPHEAACQYEKMVRMTLGAVSDFHRTQPDVDLSIHFTPPERAEEMRKRFPGPWRFILQEGGHLGDRMHRSMERAFAEGFSHVILVGTDIAWLEPADFKEAFEKLAAGHAVLGPAMDEGFYLVGLDRPCSEAFAPEEWGTDGISRRTEALLCAAGRSVRYVALKRDIDREEDFELVRSDPRFRERLSVIIPTMNPLASLEPLIEKLDDILWPGDEVIVVSSSPVSVMEQGTWKWPKGPKGLTGPQDVTASRVRVMHAPRGRGLQLNAGARAARGGLLLFLHDDCAPPPSLASSVRKLAAAPDMSLGCFHLAFSPTNRSLDLIALWANLRTRLFKLPYGDQGLFCRRETFEEIGGFQNPYLLEDVDLVHRARRRGKLLFLPETITASSRRYVQQGVLSASMSNHLILLSYILGASNSRLYDRYYGVRAKR